MYHEKNYTAIGINPTGLPRYPKSPASTPLQVEEVPTWVENAFTVAQTQSEAMYKEVMKTGLLPRSIQQGLQPKTNWTAGFFPGTLWYLYTYTGKDIWKVRAEKATALMEGEQNNAFDHDIGFKCTLVMETVIC